jgi:hypothetical protein
LYSPQPSTPSASIAFQERRTDGQCRASPRAAKGAITNPAIVQRQNAMATGGICGLMPRASTMFAAQNRVASASSR